MHADDWLDSFEPTQGVAERGEAGSGEARQGIQGSDGSADWLEGAQVATSTESAGTAPIEVATPTLPAVADERNALIWQAWREISELQRRYLEIAEHNRFSYAATAKSSEWTALVPCPARFTVLRWRKQPAFKLILNVMKAAAANEALSKDDLVVHAAAIRERALTPKPILYQGSPTGFTEFQGDVALRANEQLAKLGGHMKQEDVTQGQQGPALLVQIIQGEGKVVDVTPRGVTIDLPAPDGA